MAKKETYQSCLWSDNKDIINETIVKLDERGIESRCDDRLGIHIISVKKKKYAETVAFARENLDPQNIGIVNHYGIRRHLYDRSLIYAYIKDAKQLGTGWESPISQPRFVREMLTKLSNLCGCPLKLRVNTADHAIEIIANGYLNDDEEVRNKIISYFYENAPELFENIYKCADDGRLIKKDSTRKRDTIYNLFDTTVLASGMSSPLGANIVPKTDGELLTESGYKSSSMRGGCQKQKQTIVLKNADKIVINGSAELYELKKYYYTWNAATNTQNEILPLESSLVDNITYNTTIVLDKDVVKVTTNYTDNREATVSRRLPFNMAYPNESSIRNGFLKHPLKTGNYSGIIEEYYMRSNDGTKLLHFATSSPYFEIYDIPEDFDFVNNNAALVKVPAVYDIRNYNPEEPELQSVKNIIANDAQKLMLTSN